MMRKNHSAAFKAKIVLEALRETKPLTQIAAENQIHRVPSGWLVTKWKSEATSGLLELFERGKRRDEGLEASERKIAELYQEIGKLTTQVNWLKKTTSAKLP